LAVSSNNGRPIIGRYEADKMKYYYAVAVFDSTRTARSVYQQCDGVEFEVRPNMGQIWVSYCFNY
jgi:hypothetical protein